MAMVKAAILRAPDSVYMGMVEIDESELGPRHLLASEFGGECDLPVGRYAWDAAEKSFKSVEAIANARIDPVALDMLTQLAMALLRVWSEHREVMTRPILEWLDFYVMSVDFPAELHRNPIVRRYKTVRRLGITEATR